MNNVEYVLVSPKEWLDTCDALCRQDFEEVYGRDDCAPDLDFYETLTKGTLSFAYLAKVNDEVVGYSSVIVFPHPHYDVVVANNDALYVLPEYRRSIISARLIVLSEREACRRGATTFVWQAPSGSDFEKTLSNRKDYKRLEVAFKKELTNGKD